MRIPLLNWELNDELFRIGGWSITGLMAILLIGGLYLGMNLYNGTPVRILGFRLV